MPISYVVLRTRRAFLAVAASLAWLAPAWAAPLTIAVTPSALSLPVDVAHAMGFFAAEGAEVKVVDCGSGSRCLQMLFDRAAQLATATELPVVTASFERSDYAIVSTLATSTGNIRLVGRKSAGVGRAEQLAGKRIGVIVGSSSHYYLDSYLLFHDIDPKGIKLVPLAPENIVAAMEQQQVDAISGHSRHTGPVLKALGTDGIALNDPHIYTETYNLVADRHTLAQRGAEIVKVLRALDRAERFIAEQPVRAKQILMSRTLLDATMVEAVFPSFTYRLSLSQSLVSAMEGQARWAVREGHALPSRKAPNYLDFIEPGPLRTAAPGALPR